ncbi:MAG: hypothetical protein HY852_17460, partial [Bradyrhizobium sp.]|uniref:hypothetical protein n=1 Tax=Bradyrhizobium sp. TaxID=376 RepID=UPI0025C255AF
LIDHDLDASVLRFMLNGVSHVAVLGQHPLTPQETVLISLAFGDGGEPTDVPTDIVARLQERRRQMTHLGFDYVERRSETRPPDA